MAHHKEVCLTGKQKIEHVSAGKGHKHSSSYIPLLGMSSFPTQKIAYRQICKFCYHLWIVGHIKKKSLHTYITFYKKLYRLFLDLNFKKHFHLVLFGYLKISTKAYQINAKVVFEISRFALWQIWFSILNCVSFVSSFIA